MEEIQKILQKINAIEARVAKLESGKIILDERKMVSKPKEIEGKVLTSLPGGGISKRIYVNFCDSCGSKIEDKEFYVCKNCGKKLCENCAFKYNNAYLCLECLQKILPLPKQQYEILVAIANGITDPKKISNVTKVEKRNVRDCLNNLINSNMLEKRGISIFTQLSVTDRGLEAIGIYRKAYGRDEDIIQLDRELRRYLENEEG